MAHDGTPADRLRADLVGRAGITEQRMFGGLMFLPHGHLLAGLRGAAGLPGSGPMRGRSKASAPRPWAGDR